MKAKLAKLIDVKSIMTLLLTLVFCVMALTSVIDGREFMAVFTMIVGFYFGTQKQKTEEKSGGAPARLVAVPVPKQEYTGNEVEAEANMDTMQLPDSMQPIGFARD